jgi:hypothetical protein
MHIADAVRSLLDGEPVLSPRPRLHDMKDYVNGLFDALASGQAS